MQRSRLGTGEWLSRIIIELTLNISIMIALWFLFVRDLRIENDYIVASILVIIEYVVSKAISYVYNFLGMFSKNKLPLP